jgi:AAA15 family ATPase/GTPase
MKLRKVTINNYLSLKNVTLSFGDLTILVGRNGSGKTSILEALPRTLGFKRPEAGHNTCLSHRAQNFYDFSRPVRLVKFDF